MLPVRASSAGQNLAPVLEHAAHGRLGLVRVPPAPARALAFPSVQVSNGGQTTCQTRPGRFTCHGLWNAFERKSGSARRSENYEPAGELIVKRSFEVVLELVQEYVRIGR